MDRTTRALIQKIEKSFSSSILYDGMTLRKCVGIDARVEENEPDLAGISQCLRWQEIPENDMDLFGTHGILIHCGKNNTQFYLPPAMIYVLEHYDGSVLHPAAEIVNATEYAIEAGPPLNETQTEVVYEYVSWLKSLLV